MAGMNTPAISRNPVPQLSDLSDDIRTRILAVQEKAGFVPNVLAAYAHDNAKLEAVATFYNDLMLAPSGLSKLEREMIAVAVSSQNRCYYCLTAHGAAVRVYSGDPALGELMAMNYRAAKLTGKQRAMLDFAVKMTNESYAIEEEDREALRRAETVLIAKRDEGRRGETMPMPREAVADGEYAPQGAVHGLSSSVGGLKPPPRRLPASCGGHAVRPAAPPPGAGEVSVRAPSRGPQGPRGS